MPDDDPPKRGRGRPRSEATHDAIVDAALELAASTDYRDLSIERIALEAKVGKQSIYRWWPSKAELLLHAFTARSMNRLPPYLPSGDAFADLEDFLRRLLIVLRKPVVAKILRGLVAEAILDPAFAAKLDGEFLEVRRARIHQICHHGIALATLPRDADVAMAASLLLTAAVTGLSRPPRQHEDPAALIAFVRAALSAPRR